MQKAAEKATSYSVFWCLVCLSYSCIFTLALGNANQKKKNDLMLGTWVTHTSTTINSTQSMLPMPIDTFVKWPNNFEFNQTYQWGKPHWVHESIYASRPESTKKTQHVPGVEIIRKMCECRGRWKLWCFSWFHLSTTSAVKAIENPNRSVNARWIKTLTANGVTFTHEWNYLFLSTSLSLFRVYGCFDRPPRLIRSL